MSYPQMIADPTWDAGQIALIEKYENEISRVLEVRMKQIGDTIICENNLVYTNGIVSRGSGGGSGSAGAVARRRKNTNSNLSSLEASSDSHSVVNESVKLLTSCYGFVDLVADPILAKRRLKTLRINLANANLLTAW